MRFSVQAVKNVKAMIVNENDGTTEEDTESESQYKTGIMGLSAAATLSKATPPVLTYSDNVVGEGSSYSVTANDGTTGLSNASFEFDVDQASGAEVLVAQMNAIKNGKWVLLWRLSGGSTSVVNGANVSSATFPFSLTVDSIGTQGTYEACAAVLYNNTYYVIPNTYKTFQIAFVAPSLAVVWNVCEWNAAMTEVSFEVAIQNSGNSAQSVGAHTITLRETSSTPQAGVQPSGSSPASFTSNAATVPAGSTVVVKTGKFTGITYNQAKQYYVTFAGSQFTYEYTAIEEPEVGPE